MAREEWEEATSEWQAEEEGEEEGEGFKQPQQQSTYRQSARQPNNVATALYELADEGIAINRINITGNRRTKDDVIRRILEPLERVKTFGEALLLTQQAQHQLKALGIFDSVTILLEEPSQPHTQTSAFATPCDVIVNVKEKSPLFSKVDVTWSNQRQGTASFQAGLRNVLTGRCDTLAVDFSTGNKTTSAYSLGFQQPLLFRQRPSFVRLALSRATLSEAKYSSYFETTTGLHAEYSDGPHTVSYQLVWRDVWPEKRASFAVLSESGHSLKSSVKYAYQWDSRDDRGAPTTGSALMVQQELAGLGGDVRFLKSEAAVQANAPIGRWMRERLMAKAGAFLRRLLHNAPRLDKIALNVAVNGGLIVPLGGDHTRINDRFFLGSPLLFRGFRAKGAGDSAARRDPIGAAIATKRDALGGDAYVSGSVHLRLPFPQPVPDLLSAHVFASAGSITRLSAPHKNLADQLGTGLRNGIRSAVGAGIVFSVGGARIEVNWCMPLRKKDTDKLSTFQVGITLGL